MTLARCANAVEQVVPCSGLQCRVPGGTTLRRGHFQSLNSLLHPRHVNIAIHYSRPVPPFADILDKPSQMTEVANLLGQLIVNALTFPSPSSGRLPILTGVRSRPEVLGTTQK